MYECQEFTWFPLKRVNSAVCYLADKKKSNKQANNTELKLLRKPNRQTGSNEATVFLCVRLENEEKFI